VEQDNQYETFNCDSQPVYANDNREYWLIRQGNGGSNEVVCCLLHFLQHIPIENDREKISRNDSTPIIVKRYTSLIAISHRKLLLMIIDSGKIWCFQSTQIR
jgi:hypothetical protein